ncbi:hypothetical protein B566_EDAN016134 [Ephemera danica]|nr:hypothetical protein B566_EDAN016134 [Ephemera danica]
MSRMPLFTVNRYKDEGSNRTQGCIDKETEKKRLAELLSKVQKRKEKIKLKRLKTSAKGAAKKVKKQVLEKETTVNNTAPQDASNSEIGPASSINHDATTHSEGSEIINRQEANDKEDTANTEGFTVLGKDQFKKVKKVKAPLPKWLAKPTVITTKIKQQGLQVNDASYLSPTLRNSLLQQNVSSFFAVQNEIIAWILQEYETSLAGYWPRDLCVSAPTGSGKTLAFVLPIIQILQSRKVCDIRALVLLPTQTLARQVFQVFHEYSKGTCLNVVLATGQVSVQKEQAQLVSEDSCGFHSLADIFVTTPGRLLHHLRDTPGFSLHKLRFLVVDEADRVMDGAQNNWLHHLDQHLASVLPTSVTHQPCQALNLSISNLRRFQPSPQKLLFSATITHDPEKLSQLGLFQPKLFTFVAKDKKASKKNDAAASDEADMIGQFAMPAEIKEFRITCEDEGAKPLLLHCLLTAKKKKTLCFTSTRMAAHRLALLLTKLSAQSKESCLLVAEISAGLHLQERDAILTKFAKGELDVIVSSDALARGIDIPCVDCVVSYDAPQLTQQYVHRMGRTGRAGRKGTAITLLGPQQQGAFEHMLRTAGRLEKVQLLEPPLEQMQDLEEMYREALASVRQQIEFVLIMTV